MHLVHRRVYLVSVILRIGEISVDDNFCIAKLELSQGVFGVVLFLVFGYKLRWGLCEWWICVGSFVYIIKCVKPSISFVHTVVSSNLCKLACMCASWGVVRIRKC